MKQNELLTIVNELGEIAYAEKCESYTIISNSLDRQIIVDLSLEEIQRSVPEMKLLRVHKSHLINISHLTEIIEAGSNCQLKLTNGKTIPVAKRRKRELVKHINLL